MKNGFMYGRQVDIPMATFYTIHCYDQNYALGDDVLDEEDSYNLYSTFEKAVNAIEIHIRKHIDRYNENREPTEEEEVFTKPNATMKEGKKYCHYYETYDNFLFVICRMTVID